MLIKRRLYLLVNALNRLFDALDMKARSQHRVMPDDTLPCFFENRDIYFLRQGTYYLHNIHSGTGGIKAVKKHPVLQGRQRVGIFNLLDLHDDPMCLTIDFLG